MRVKDLHKRDSNNMSVMWGTVTVLWCPFCREEQPLWHEDIFQLVHALSLITQWVPSTNSQGTKAGRPYSGWESDHCMLLWQKEIQFHQQLQKSVQHWSHEGLKSGILGGQSQVPKPVGKKKKNQIIHIPFSSYENLTVFKAASEWVLCSSKIFSNILPWMLVWSKKVLKDAVPSSRSCGILERVCGTPRWPRQAATILGSLGCGGSSQFCYCEHETRLVARQQCNHYKYSRQNQTGFILCWPSSKLARSHRTESLGTAWNLREPWGRSSLTFPRSVLIRDMGLALGGRERLQRRLSV